MEPREIYDNIIEAYKANNIPRLGYYGEQWMTLNLENPFKPGTPEADFYYNAHLCYKRWSSQSIAQRRARIEISEYIERLAALNVPNPYAKKEVKKEPKKEVKKEQAAEKESKEQMHVLGVIPDEIAEKELKTPETKTVTNTAENKEVLVETDPKKGFFSKHKKR